MKQAVIKSYYEGREEASCNIEITNDGEVVSVTGYDGIEKVNLKNAGVMIHGSFIMSIFIVEIVDISKKYETIGIPLAVALDSYDKARVYARKASKIIGAKFMEDILYLSISLTDRNSQRIIN